MISGKAIEVQLHGSGLRQLIDIKRRNWQLQSRHYSKLKQAMFILSLPNRVRSCYVADLSTNLGGSQGGHTAVSVERESE